MISLSFSTKNSARKCSGCKKLIGGETKNILIAQIRRKSIFLCYDCVLEAFNLMA